MVAINAINYGVQDLDLIECTQSVGKAGAVREVVILEGIRIGAVQRALLRSSEGSLHDTNTPPILNCVLKLFSNFPYMAGSD